jgi:hypothetical protein
MSAIDTNAFGKDTIIFPKRNEFQEIFYEKPNVKERVRTLSIEH